MHITLSPAQQAWLESKVANGEFASLQEAASAAITDSMAAGIDDLAWARPYVQRARDDLLHGDVLTLEEHRGRMAARLDGHKG
jgi:antitoxin ParD1/3/4